MKKCLVVISVMCLALLAGCGGNKVLTCTKQLSSTGVKMVQTANVKFSGNKIDSMNTTIVATLPDSYKSLIDTFVKQFKTQYNCFSLIPNRKKVVYNFKIDCNSI